VSGINAFVPRLALSLGDPAGIGPEVVLKALTDPQITQGCTLTLIGSRLLLQQTFDQLSGLHRGLVLASPDRLPMVDLPPEAGQGVLSGQGTAVSGAMSFRSLAQAIALTLQGRFDGIVTAPIAKAAWKLAGHSYPGQTELLAERAGCERYGMLFVAQSPHTGWVLRTLLATTHIPLCQVPATLNPELMTQKLELLLDCLWQDFGIAQPRIAIAGLNPHSGEQGQLGQEEQAWLIPWLKGMEIRHPQVRLIGPVPPDTLWVEAGKAWFGTPRRSPEHPMPADAYLALYHDQGLIPVKLMAFDRAVNTSIGLPFVRTSPDHGTAFDIAGKGIADASSLKAAIALATRLCQHRQAIRATSIPQTSPNPIRDNDEQDQI